MLCGMSRPHALGPRAARETTERARRLGDSEDGRVANHRRAAERSRHVAPSEKRRRKGEECRHVRCEDEQRLAAADVRPGERSWPVRRGAGRRAAEAGDEGVGVRAQEELDERLEHRDAAGVVRNETTRRGCVGESVEMMWSEGSGRCGAPRAPPVIAADTTRGLTRFARLLVRAARAVARQAPSSPLSLEVRTGVRSRRGSPACPTV